MSIKFYLSEFVDIDSFYCGIVSCCGEIGMLPGICSLLGDRFVLPGCLWGSFFMLDFQKLLQNVYISCSISIFPFDLQIFIV